MWCGRPSSSRRTRSSSSQSWTTTRPRKARARSGRISPSSSRRPARRPSPPATSTVCRSREIPAALSASSTAASASRRGSSAAEGTGRRRRLDDDRRAAVARRDDVKRRAGERISERLDDGRADVDDRIERRRRYEQHRIVGNRDERKTRAGRERDAHPGHPRSGSRPGPARSADRAEQAEERRPKPEAGPGARREQVRHPPVRDDCRVARVLRPGEDRLAEHPTGAEPAMLG